MLLFSCGHESFAEFHDLVLLVRPDVLLKRSYRSCLSLTDLLDLLLFLVSQERHLSNLAPELFQIQADPRSLQKILSALIDSRVVSRT